MFGRKNEVVKGLNAYVLWLELTDGEHSRQSCSQACDSQVTEVRVRRELWSKVSVPLKGSYWDTEALLFFLLKFLYYLTFTR